MLAVAPRMVRPDQARAGATATLAELMPQMIRGGIAAVSPNGVLGDPDGANGDAGQDLVDSWVDQLEDFLSGWPSSGPR